MAPWPVHYVTDGEVGGSSADTSLYVIITRLLPGRHADLATRAQLKENIHTSCIYTCILSALERPAIVIFTVK